jgi:hypothetical protein
MAIRLIYGFLLLSLAKLNGSSVFLQMENETT